HHHLCSSPSTNTNDLLVSSTHNNNNKKNMNFHRIFLLVVVAIFLVLGGHSGVEAAPRWKLGKKLEKVGKNVFKAAQKTLPVVAGFKALG
ncbi:hypothetical protein pipiens_009119, partial [Culex pipiens pipiens]